MLFLTSVWSPKRHEATGFWEKSELALFSYSGRYVGLLLEAILALCQSAIKDISLRYFGRDLIGIRSWYYLTICCSVILENFLYLSTLSRWIVNYFYIAVDKELWDCRSRLEFYIDWYWTLFGTFYFWNWKEFLDNFNTVLDLDLRTIYSFLANSVKSEATRE